MNARATARASLCAVLLASLSACSLLLDELDITCKNSHDDCAALNRKYGLDDGAEGACKIYQCRADRRGCELRPRDYDDDGFADEQTCADELPGDLDCDDGDDAGAPLSKEICDGKDNDCDGVIDEEALKEENLAEPLSLSLAAPDVARVSYGSGPDLALTISLTRRAGDQATTSMIGWALTTGLSAATLTNDASPSCDGGCKIGDAALAGSDDLLLALGVSIASCDRLRVGVSNKPAEPALTWDGLCATCPADSLSRARTNLNHGIDAEPTNAEGLQFCAQSGASSPSLALLANDKQRPQEALALWRAGPELPAVPLPLAGMPLTLQRAASNQGPVIAVQGPSDRSHSFEAQASLGFDAAVIRAFRSADRSGYLVAYDSQDGVELALVPNKVSADFREVVHFSLPSAGARHVSLALANSEDAAIADGALGLTWRNGDDRSGTLFFAQLSFDPKADRPFELRSCLSLGESRALRDGPGVAYAEQGFREGELGGFFVTWVEHVGLADNLVAARLPVQLPASSSCETRLESVSLEPPFLLAHGPSIDHTFTFSDAERGLRYAFVSNDTGQRLNIGALQCRP